MVNVLINNPISPDTRNIHHLSSVLYSKFISQLFANIQDNDGYTHKKTGTYFPFHTRDIPYPSFVFKMLLEYGTGHTIYMRFLNGASMTLPLTLFSAEAFTQKSQKEQLIAGLFYGIFNN